VLGVVKIGSALFSEEGAQTLQNLRNFIRSFNGDLVFVSGAGPEAKKLVEGYRNFEFPEGFLDYLGIKLTHVNALALARLISGKYCKDFEEIERNVGKLPVTGGQIPGQSTDAVAAEVADYLGADLLILVKDVGGIYPKDPKEWPGVRIIHKISLGDLKDMIKAETSAGKYGVIDPQAFSIISRSKIRTFVVGPDFKFEEGTEILPEV
jgi:uridylate kinase